MKLFPTYRHKISFRSGPTNRPTDQARQGRARQGKAGQGRARQGKAGQGKAGQGTHLEVALAIDEFGILLGQPNGAILQGGEHSGGHIDIIHEGVVCACQSLGQQSASLDGHGGQLLFALHHVPHSIDVWHIGLLVHCGDEHPGQYVGCRGRGRERGGGREGERGREGKRGREKCGGHKVKIGLATRQSI